jgi:hypothetical protein
MLRKVRLIDNKRWKISWQVCKLPVTGERLHRTKPTAWVVPYPTQNSSAAPIATVTAVNNNITMVR